MKKTSKRVRVCRIWITHIKLKQNYDLQLKRIQSIHYTFVCFQKSLYKVYISLLFVQYKYTK